MGSDGVGKTTIADALADQYGGPTAYFHFRPSLREGMRPRPDRDAALPPPKHRTVGRRVVGLLRLVRNVVLFRLSYWRRIRPAVRSGSLVVGDRWFYGYLVQPVALKFAGPEWAARVALKLVPRPDLVANLVCPPEVVRARKQELSVEEIETELRAWARLPESRLRCFDAQLDPVTLAGSILEEIRR